MIDCIRRPVVKATVWLVGMLPVTVASVRGFLLSPPSTVHATVTITVILDTTKCVQAVFPPTTNSQYGLKNIRYLDRRPSIPSSPPAANPATMVTLSDSCYQIRHQNSVVQFEMTGYYVNTSFCRDLGEVV